MSEQNFDQQRQLYDTVGQNAILNNIEIFVIKTANTEYGTYFQETLDSGKTQAERISDDINDAKPEDLEVFDPSEGYNAKTINLFSGQQSEDPRFKNEDLNEEFKNRAQVFSSLYDKLRPKSTKLYSLTAQGYGRSLYKEGRFLSDGRDFSEGFQGDRAIVDEKGAVRGVRLELGNGVFVSFEVGEKGYEADRSSISRIDLHIIGPNKTEENAGTVEDTSNLPELKFGEVALVGAQESQDSMTDSQLSEFMEKTTDGNTIAKHFKDIQITRQAIEDYMGDGLKRHEVPEHVLRHLKAKFLGSHDYLYDKLGKVRHATIADNERNQAKQAIDELSDLSNSLLDTAEIMMKNPNIRTGKVVDTYRADPTKSGAGVKILDKGWKVGSVNVDGSIVVTKVDPKGKNRKKTVDAVELNRVNSTK